LHCTWSALTEGVFWSLFMFFYSPSNLTTFI
jgi:hypothetical protein